MPSLSWYLRRARAMSPAEVAWRAEAVARKAVWRRQRKAGFADPPPARVRLPAERWLERIDHPEAAALLAEAEEALAHRWRFFALDGVEEETIDWHRDPESGRVASRGFGFDIDHRDERLVGNIKNTWEKSRHHHLTVLAAAYALSGEPRYADEVAAQLRSWVEDNPYHAGVHWTHPLESGIRLIAWVWCERLLRGSPAHDDAFGPESMLWPSVYRHLEFIRATYSRGSSANNHLIGELAGLFIACRAWPFWDASRAWGDWARSGLEQCMERQVFASGVNREMAFAYHVFTLEFFLLCAGEARDDFSQAFQSRLRAMVEFLPAATDVGGGLPRYGDGDEGRAVQLEAAEAPRDRWLRAVGRAWVGAEVGVEDSLAACLLLGSGPETVETAPVGSVGFEDAGLYILSSERGAKGEVWLLADAGPHGYLSIAAHAHADALSFALSVGGVPLLVDPGTYAYHTDRHWRDYFRSTAAHNTVQIDGEDQSSMLGPFLWGRRAVTRVHAWSPAPEGGELEAEHDGYARLGVRHHRRWHLDGRTLTIEDRLEGRGTHQVAVQWHAHPGCRVVRESRGEWTLRHGNSTACLTFPPEFAIEATRGTDQGGWYSPRFAWKEETTTLSANARLEAPASWRTVMRILYED